MFFKKATYLSFAITMAASFMTSEAFATNTILDLPDGVQNNTFSYLDFQTLMEARPTCKALNTTIKNSVTAIPEQYQERITTETMQLFPNLLSTVTASNPYSLRINGLTGQLFATKFLSTLSILDLKERTARTWNTKHKTNYTHEKVCLTGCGSFVNYPEQCMVYEDNYTINIKAIQESNNKAMYLVIKL